MTAMLAAAASPMVLSNWQANTWLEQFQVGTWWLGLHIYNPAPLGDPSSELMGAGYKRRPIYFSRPAGRATVNTNPIVFPLLPACTISHLAVWGSLSGGNLSWVIQLPGGGWAVQSSGEVLVAAGDVALIL